MNTIKIYLSASGRIANLLKDFPLYKGQFNDKLLNVYVPTSILAPQFDIQHYIGQNTVSTLPDDSELASFVEANTYPSREPETGDIVEIYNETTQKYYVYVYGTDSWTSTEVTSFGTFNNIAGTSVKIGMIATKPNGVMYQSKSYFMRYLKTLTYQNVEYALYERKLPKEFTSFVGQGQNAPTLIANVVNVDTEDNTVTSLITSQSCKLDVMESTMLDQDETIQASDLETFEAELDVLSAKVDLKQDKIDQTLNTTSKSVVGAINGLASSTSQNASDIHDNAQAISEIQGEQISQNEKISTNEDNIATNTGNISDLQERVSTLEQASITGETYIGTMTGSSLPTSTQLTNYVVATADRQPKGGDYVYFTLIVSGGTDKNYKYAYSSVSGWDEGAEIPAMEEASNGTLGIVKGTYGDSTKNTQVNIDGGEILSVHVKDNSNTMRDVREYLNTTASTLANTNTQVNTNTGDIFTQGGKISTLEGQMSNILDGTTSVGSAVKTTNDGLNRNIAQTYLTQTSGVTKTQMKEYALPRAFNDVSYLTSEGYGDTLGDSANPIYTATSTSVGDTQIFSANKEISNYEFQLASKNSYTTTLYISASANCTVQLRLGTELDVNGNWYNAVYELTDSISFTANEIKKVTFNSTLALLDQVYNIGDGDAIRQTLEVITDTSSSLTFNVYSNDTYPSTFYLNTTSQTIATSQGLLGEIPVYMLTGTLSDTTLTFAMPTGATLNNNTVCLLKLNYSGSVSSVTAIQISYDNSNVKIVVPPYNKTTLTNATPSDLSGVYTNGVGYEFEGLIQQVSGDFVVYATIGGANSGGGSNITIDDTVGSESISDGVKTLNVVTRDTNQTITAPKTISLSGVNDTYSKSISASGEQLTISRPDNTYQKTNSAGIVFEQLSSSSNGSSRSTSNQIVSYAGASSGYYRTYTPDATETSKTLSASMSVSDSKSELKYEDKTGSSTVTHTLSVDTDGVKEDGTLLSSTYQKITDNTLNTTNKTIVGAINELDSSVGDIDDLIPAQASSSNQLADKEFVNSSISTNTANFIGTFANVPTLNAYSGTVTNNDYAFVVNSVITDNGNDWANTTDLNAYNKALLTNFDYAWVVNGSNFDLYRFDIINQNWVLRVTNTAKASVTLNTAYNRYKATVSGSTVTWAYEYTLNNSSFTASQWAAINSGATATNIGQIATNTSNIALKQNATDNDLTTTSKTIVGAINELNSAYGNANTTLESILGV